MSPSPEISTILRLVTTRPEALKPTTGSLNTMSTPVSTPRLGRVRPETVAVGPSRSVTITSRLGARAGLPAASATAPAAIETETGPLPFGTTSKWYSAPDPVRLRTAPLTTARSEASRPTTASLNRRATGIGPAIGPGPVELKVAVGEVRSLRTGAAEEARLPLPAESVATPAAIATEIVPSPSGTTSKR